MFTAFDRSGHRALSQAIKDELADLGKRYGLTFNVGGGQIGAASLVIKVEATSVDTTAVDDKAKRELGMYGRQYGLIADDHGAIFTSNGKRFKLTGINPGAPKYPITGECLSTGRGYKFGAGTARTIIADRNAGTLKKAA